MSDDIEKEMRAAEAVLDAELQQELELDEGVTPTPGPAVGIQLFLTQNMQGIVAMHDANEVAVAQVQMDMDQLQQMRDALDAMITHMMGMENADEDTLQ